MRPSMQKPGAAVPTYSQLTSQPEARPSRAGEPDAQEATPGFTPSVLFPLLLTLTIVFAFAALFWWDRVN
jgi:hypothetical protein